jgi:aspartyl/asparaginyl beta-hydroxylase (cupin superfamily)
VLTEAHSLIFDLARFVRAERIGRVLISRLPPGGVIAPHQDGGAVATYYTRYQMPLQSAPGCMFECDGEGVNMRAGEVWWFDNKRTHQVVNNSATDRISMIVDLKTR